MPVRGAHESGTTQVKKQRRPVAVPPPSTTQLTKSWGSLFQRENLLSTSSSLRYIEPTIDGANTVAALNPEVYSKHIKQWDQAIVGYIIGKIPVYTPFLSFLKKKWKPKGDFQLLLHGNGFFTVKFDLVEDFNVVLEGGPWTMDHRPFIVQKWTPEARMEQERLTSIPLWIRLPNLPLHLWEADCLSRIGSTIGVPLYADSATLCYKRASYARICVEVQASKALPESVLVELAPGNRETFKVEYDWKPIACQHCKTFGHDEVCCVMKPVYTVAPEKGGKVTKNASHLKGKEKVVAQWQEVHKPHTNPNRKLLSDAIKASASAPSSGKNSIPSSSNKAALSQDNPNVEISVLESQVPQRQQFVEQENPMTLNKFALLQDEEADGEDQQQQVESEGHQSKTTRVEGVVQQQQLESQKQQQQFGVARLQSKQAEEAQPLPTASKVKQQQFEREEQQLHLGPSRVESDDQQQQLESQKQHGDAWVQGKQAREVQPLSIVPEVNKPVQSGSPSFSGELMESQQPITLSNKEKKKTS
ncbi:hypothetical protein QJS04_geneDACA024128 [Acorus gramineus]|uniref:DUF4283 domain-containing protein n=1 Tax=Acorus gramineus TaxID=55184 RepID=A0AAV8ZZ96_ACOGR|nr:hypothetical protein QJS04_geneDACA024128 [Acorus gramineus]